MTFFSSRGNKGKGNKGGNTWIITNLLRCFIDAEDVKLTIQGAGVLSWKEFTGLLGKPSFSTCLWKQPWCPCATAWELPATCFPGNSLLPVVSLNDLKHCQDLITHSLEK